MNYHFIISPTFTCLSPLVSLCRYTHIEGECPFINFDGLLDRLEDLVADTVDRVMSGPYGNLVMELNPVSMPAYDTPTPKICCAKSDQF